MMFPDIDLLLLLLLRVNFLYQHFRLRIDRLSRTVFLFFDF